MLASTIAGNGGPVARVTSKLEPGESEPEISLSAIYPADHKGTATLTSDQDGEPTAKHYDPFGVLTGSSDWSTQQPLGADDLDPEKTSPGSGLGGADEQSAGGLVQMGARLYDPVAGRFTAPDPTTPDSSDPRDFNRYAYVRNNPVRYTDPSGFAPKSQDGTELNPVGAVQPGLSPKDLPWDAYGGPECGTVADPVCTGDEAGFDFSGADATLNMANMLTGGGFDIVKVGLGGLASATARSIGFALQFGSYKTNVKVKDLDNPTMAAPKMRNATVAEVTAAAQKRIAARTAELSNDLALGLYFESTVGGTPFDLSTWVKENGPEAAELSRSLEDPAVRAQLVEQGHEMVNQFAGMFAGLQGGGPRVPRVRGRPQKCAIRCAGCLGTRKRSGDGARGGISGRGHQLSAAS